ncbi:MAG: DUF1631 family protein [Cellvibrionaceae bacterium]
MTPANLPIDQILKGHTQSLLKALRLLHEHDGLPPQVALDPLDQATLLESLSQQSEYFADRLLLTGYLKHDFPQRLLSADIRSALVFVDLLISQLYVSANPDNSIDRCGRHFSLVLIVRLLSRPDIAINTEHALCRFIHQLFNHLAIWEPAAGKTGRRFSTWFDNLVAALPTLDINSSSSVNELSDQLAHHIKEDEIHQSKLEKRIEDSQGAHDQIDNAKDTVLSFVSKRLSGQLLPEEVADFIQAKLLPDLQYLLVHHGVDCTDWKKWQRLLQALSWAFTQSNSDTHRSKVMTLLPPIVEQIDDSYWRHFSDTPSYQDFFQTLNDYFVLILQNVPIHCVEFTQLGHVGKNRHQTLVDQSMIDDLERFQVGDWFSFQGDDKQRESVKAKLLLKQAHRDQLLFVRYNGRKFSDYTFSEFSLALAAKVAKPIKRRHLYARTLKTTLQKLDRRYQHHLKLEQRIAETQARDIAAHKAQQEAQTLEQRPSVNGQELSDSDKSNYESVLSALHVGAWLELQGKDQQTTRLKLSVKLQSSDKYIFTDRLGKKAADHKMSELITLMASGELRVLSQGEHFENSLEKVVRGLRKNTT